MIQDKIQILAEDIGNGITDVGACLGTAPTQERLEQLEGLILNNRLQYVPVGLALEEINKKGLYKKHAETFEDYMEQRFGLTAREGYYLISSARTAVAVDDYGDIDDDPLKIIANFGSHGKPIILDNEKKARALAGLNNCDKKQAATDAYQKALVEKRTLTARDIEVEASKYKKPKIDKTPDIEKERFSLEKELGKVNGIFIKIAEKYPSCKDKQDFFAEYIIHIEDMLKYLKDNKDK